jgi:glutathione S-transferase
MNHAGKLFHAAMSAASQKVRLVLAEKQLAWDSEEIDLRKGQQHSPDYRALNPNGVVPTLVWDGRALIESAAISEYLEDVFPEHPLRPQNPVHRHRMRVWMLRCEEYHPANGFLTYSLLVRPALGAVDPARLERSLSSIPDALARGLRREAFIDGIKAPSFADCVKTQARLLDAMEEVLAKTSHLAGDEISLADLIILPYVARLEHMGWVPEILRPRPRAANWLERMMARKSYREGILRWMAPEITRHWRAWGLEAWPAAKAVLGQRPAHAR